MSCFFPSLLPRPHGLLESIERPRLFLALRIALGPSVELSVDQLPLIKYVSKGLCSILIECHLVCHVVGQHLRPQFLLELVYLQAFKIGLGNVFLLRVRELVLVDQLL